MRAYLKLKKIDVPIESSTVIRDEVPQKNVDYTLMVRVCLKSFEKTQIEAEDDDEEVFYNLEINGDVRLLPVDFGLKSASPASAGSTSDSETPPSPTDPG